MIVWYGKLVIIFQVFEVHFYFLKIFKQITNLLFILFAVTFVLYDSWLCPGTWRLLQCVSSLIKSLLLDCNPWGEPCAIKLPSRFLSPLYWKLKHGLQGRFTRKISRKNTIIESWAERWAYVFKYCWCLIQISIFQSICLHLIEMWFTLRKELSMFG